jgi:hypothetical protein
MERYLKPRQEYLDQYDRFTVEDCRRREAFHKRGAEDGKTDEEKKMHKLFSEVALYYDLLYATVGRYDEREATVNKWMQRDGEMDRLLETATPPEGIRCLTCGTHAEANFRTIDHASEDDKPRVLFMYDCPKGCKPRRAFFNDGEEYIVKPNLMSEVQSGTRYKE